MARTSVAIEIAKPVKDVFAFMADGRNMSVWTDMESFNLNGALAAGTTGTFDLPMMGKRRVFPFVIVAFDEGRRWAVKVTNKLQLTYDYRFTPTPRGTRIDEGIEVRPRGLLRLIAPLMVRMIRSEEGGELRRLKAALEEPRAGAAASARRHSTG